jgi:hypothetical protein
MANYIGTSWKLMKATGLIIIIISSSSSDSALLNLGRLCPLLQLVSYSV